MAIAKNFVVKNGLEVNTNLIFADTNSNKVGIATTNPQYTLSVNGGIGATNSIVTGVSTVNSLVINGRITAGSSSGVSGQYLISTGDGVSWTGIPKLRTVDKKIAEVGATTFNTTYSVGLLDVFINGVRLSEEEFTAIDSATVSLNDACFGGETVEFISYSTSGLGVGFTGIQGLTILDEGTPIGSPLQVTSINFVGGAVTAIGSGLGVTVFISDTNSINENYWTETSAGIHTLSNVGIGTTNPTENLTVFGDARVTGILTIGTASITLDGSSNTITVGSGVTIDGSTGIIEATSLVIEGTTLTGAAVTSITAGSGISVDQSTGNVTISATGGGGNGESYWDQTSSGIHTLSNVGIGTTNPTSALTVKGNTSLETLSVSGVSTFSGQSTFDSGIILNGNTSNLSGSQRILLSGGEGGDTQLYNGGAAFSSFIFNSMQGGSTIEVGRLNGSGTLNLPLSQGGISVSGVSTLGIVTAGNIYSTGIITATTFVGNFSGSITDATNLTGGYANASQLNVSGIATISQGRIQADASANLRFGNLAAGSGSGRNIAIGDQVLISLSGGQGRNIGIGELSYYDTTTGQYNIGIGERAGQKVSTGSYNVILGAYDGNSGGLDIRTSSRNVVIADGEGNIRQYINSSGNVGIKTTVVTEALTVAGIVSATGFYGTLNAGQLTGSLPAIDGSALIGVVGGGSGVIIEDDATPVGTAGTINFGTNLNVSFAGGTATISGATSVSFASVAGVATTATNALGLTGTPSISVTNVTANRLILPDCGNLSNTDNTEKLTFGNTPDFKIFHLNEPPFTRQNRIEVKNYPLYIGTIEEVTPNNFSHTNLVSLIPGTTNAKVELGFGTSFPNTKLETTGYGVSVYGGINASGIITAASFSGSGSGLTNIPSGQLTGSLPALDGSALINLPAQPGDGINVSDNDNPVGSARTVNFATGLDVTISGGIATITASGGSLQSRTTVSGTTASIANNGIGNTDITGFKSYALMRVGLSTAGWLRIYTDSASRDADVSRSVGEDPAPGSGVIAEVVTTGISTTQIISPFVMGGNLDNPADTTIYASIKNLSGSTQAITANLTILQLEA